MPYTFNLTGPQTGDIIDSINVVVDGAGTQSQSARRDIQLTLTKTAGGTNTPVGNTLSDVNLILGAACANSGNTSVNGQGLWGTTWTPAQVTASGFGIIIQDDDATAHAIGVDAITVTVWYHTPSTGSDMSRRSRVLRSKR